MKCLYNINGIEVNASFPDEAIVEIYMPLLRRLTEMQKKKGGRLLVMLAAPPGAGKTTLSYFLQELSETRGGITPLQAVGIDGFHRYQDYLLSHTAEVDGRKYPMVKIKGAPETFDLEKLTEYVKRAAAGESFGWPGYNRLLHNPVEDAVTVERDIVLLEGNYLLLDEPGWRELKNYADYTVFIRAEEGELTRRLIARKEASGAAHEEAVAHVMFSDLRNARTCLEKSMCADLELG